MKYALCALAGLALGIAATVLVVLAMNWSATHMATNPLFGNVPPTDAARRAIEYFRPAEYTDPPLEAVLAEVLTVPLFRRWLAAQGDRVFYERNDDLTPVGRYLVEVAGMKRPLPRHLEWPAWVKRLGSTHLLRHSGRLDARGALADLDEVLATDWKTYGD